jgi:uncharacterized OsmC-like protein
MDRMAEIGGDDLNGIDLASVRSIVERYREDPGSGHRPFAARVRWLGGYRTESHLGNVLLVHGDEPVELAGAGTGPSPEDMLLGAVGQCLIVGLAGSAAARGIRLDELEVHVHGTVNLTAAYGLDEGASPGFERIDIDVHARSDAPRSDLEELIAHAMALAPIPNTVQRPVPVHARLD